MKFISVCVIVCAIALNLSFNCASRPPNIVGRGVNASIKSWEISPTSGQNEGDQVFNHYDFKVTLQEQYDELCDKITMDTMLKCADKHSAPFDEIVKLFLGRIGKLNDMTTADKCAVDCTMRGMGVMGDNGLIEAEYMAQIKKLRRNYTSFDINKKSDETRREILQILSNQIPHLYRDDACFSRFGPKRVNLRSNETRGEVCNALLQSYTMAASECKAVRGSDMCETSWLTMHCMKQSHNKRFFESPFYPVPYTDRLTLELDRRNRNKRLN